MELKESIAGQILALRDRGYSEAEISRELKLPRGRVKAVLRQAHSRSQDSRRIFECHEMLLEILAILREIRGLSDTAIARRMRVLEQRDLPQKLGAAIDQLNSPGPLDTEF